MQLEHQFTVPVPRDQAWDVLMNVEQIAPCMPGATLDSVDGDEFAGRVKVKVGPIQVTYAGKARFEVADKEAGRAVIWASGRESRGSGTAQATIHTQLHEDGDSTRVEVVTDLDITGRPAQFGRGVMVEVGNKILGQFTDCLEAQIQAGKAAEAAPAEGAPGEAPAEGAAPKLAAVPPPRPSAEAIDLLETAGAPVLKRVLPLVGALLAIFLVWRLVRRRSH